MPLVVDTYNVLQVEGVLPPEIAGLETADLIGLIRESRYRRRRAVLVCDGFPPPDGPRSDGPITVVFAGRESADDVIVKIVARSSAPRRLLVVTSDREVLRDARKRRCGTMESAEFLAQLAEDHGTSAIAPPPASVEPGDATPPEDVLAEAEALERSLRSEIAEMEAEIAARLGAPEPAEEDDAPPDEAEEDPLAALLPAELIEEAEALGRDEGAEPPEEPSPPPGPVPERPPAGPAPDPGPDPLPRSVIDEADRLWREAADEPPPPRAD